ncbi:hypothetical protein [Aridibaculum aurantiacum]|uniref:hypothetical protein n=1 Tax=Aridibaculum aurantiacum TaxID=2810307 RepID=UPI001A963C18|nr:hypothetical protein [Aridibaculum aurantiacum]
MKYLIVTVLAFGLAASAEAQNKVRSTAPSRARVVVAAPVVPAWGMGMGMGFGWGPARWSPFYSPFYDPFYDPYYRGRMVQSRVPSELQLKLDEIVNEYDYRISSTRNDNSLSGKERRQKIRELRYQKEGALIDAKRNYLKSEPTGSENK